MRKLSLFTIIFLLAGIIYAITLNVTLPEKLDQFITTLTAQDEFSGSVIVALNDNIVLRKGYGLARVDMPNTPETRFCI